jgi:hypothetical protein
MSTDKRPMIVGLGAFDMARGVRRADPLPVRAGLSTCLELIAAYRDFPTFMALSWPFYPSLREYRAKGYNVSMQAFDWLGYQCGRMIWAFDHLGDQWVTGFAAVVTMLITAVLAYLNYRYMVLAERQTATAVEQLRAAVRPIIKVRLDFQGGQDNIGGTIFTDEILAAIQNTGANPLVLRAAKIAWYHSEGIGNIECDLPKFRDVVLDRDQRHWDVCKVCDKDGNLPAFSNFNVWAEHVCLTVTCSDVGGLSSVTYTYQEKTGLGVVAAPLAPVAVRAARGPSPRPPGQARNCPRPLKF